jgi:hypothetical protein
LVNNFWSCPRCLEGVDAREDPGRGRCAGRETEGHGVADVELNDMDVAGVYVTPEVDMMIQSSAIKVQTFTGKEITFDFDDVVGAIKDPSSRRASHPSSNGSFSEASSTPRTRPRGLRSRTGIVLHLVLAKKGNGCDFLSLLKDDNFKLGSLRVLLSK